ncbi:MAG: ComF family protein [Hyphomicrobiaceae bacterium]
MGWWRPPLHTAGRLVANAARSLADVILPPLCLACRRALGTHDTLCGPCWHQINFIRKPLCDKLGVPLPFDPGGPIVSAEALAHPPVYDRARAVARFDGVMRRMIHELKYADRHDARRLFGRWLSEAGAELLADADAIVPVPLHRWRLLWRRFNQAALLAAEVSHLAGVPHDPLLLRRTRATPQQVGLPRSERVRNMTGVFAVADGYETRVTGRRIVLLDDVVTTGATIDAAAGVLKRAGAARVDVLALALVTDDARINF